ncbi:ATP-binding protein [Cupriavidus plantarum]|uniref:Putative ATPase n=1 Tax=Cupriavidus plantarum TaxID=942865 RepID=A0A316ESZ2_9BURK|nr:winged helix-turn-helix domain-containing protein [Cupriavidus plantarum]PWK35474.1 putative ATPase [Cupriavidus plantarum]
MTAFATIAASVQAEIEEVIAFGAFRLFPARRRLERDGVYVPLSSRAMDILIALLERAGDVIDKRELIARAWRNMVVDESNLRVHIAGLRRLLDDGDGGARYVTNVPGRGYCFVGQITRVRGALPGASGQGAVTGGGVERVAERVAEKVAEKPAAEEDAARAPVVPILSGGSMPQRLARMVGRDEAVRDIAAALPAHRFMSIVGPGGIGKTTVAVAIAHGVASRCGAATYFIDLHAINRGAQSDNDALRRALEAFAATMPATPTLIVLDNCEHVSCTAALFAERLVARSPAVHVLATSREALRAEGEQVYRLPPLASPPSDAPFTAAQAQAYPAVQLFLERAEANGHPIAMTDSDARQVADICRRLDGVPLAIELAAGRVGAFGIDGTAALLDTRFLLHWQGRRTAPSRHRTLGALLDWSHDLLSDVERAVFARLAAFDDAFALHTALDAIDEGERADVVDAIDGLVAKSLLAAKAMPDDTVRYRLPAVARVYAAEKRRTGHAAARAQPLAEVG